jgi:hypothetical protein
LEEGINAHRAGKPIGRSFVGRLCATSFDFHKFVVISWPNEN